MNLLEHPNVRRELDWPGPITKGAQGRDVRRLQEWLNLRGLGTSIDGEFGPATEVQLREFQRRERLASPAGIADSATFGALSAPMRRAFGFWGQVQTLRGAVVAVATAHLRQQPREVGGDNRGPWVRAYCGADGAGYRWCAGFALTMVRQACAIVAEPMSLPFTLSCDELATAAKKAGRLTHDPAKVRPGDLGLCYRDTASGRDWFHVYVITGVHAAAMNTIEGNTNDEGSANGYEVCARMRGLALKDYVLLG